MKIQELFWEPLDMRSVLGREIRLAINAAQVYWERLGIPRPLLNTLRDT